MKRYSLVILLVISAQLIYAQADSSKISKDYKKFYYPNGNISSEGYLKEGKPTGFWISYYVSGVKKSEGNWRNGLLDSTWLFFNQVGDTAEKVNYYLGKKNGYHFKYYTGYKHQNQIKQKDLYVNGERNGISYVYYPGAKKELEIPYVNDKKNGMGFHYDETGKIIGITRYRSNEIIVHENINGYDDNNKKHGIWKEFYDDKTIKKELNYSHGKLDGLVKLYNREGKLVNAIKYDHGEVDLNAKEFNENVEIIEKYDENQNIIFQGGYKKDIPIGVHRYFNNKGEVIKSETYDINGKLLAKGIVLQNGQENGEWTYYYSNNTIRATGTYNHGKKTGLWTYYYPNGKIQQKGSYLNGKLTGNWNWYYNTGQILKEEVYIYGRPDGECIEYSEEGNIISNGNYIEGYKEGKWLFIIGDQKHEGSYVMGAKNGIWRSYYLQEEKLSFEGRYLQGNEDGKHEYYYPNGKLKEEQYYSEGQKVRAWSKYDKEGELILVVQYREGLPFKINGEKVKLSDWEND